MRRPNPKVEREAARLEALADAHPCRRCPERAKHERWAGRAAELQRRLGGVERRIRVRTETLARQFDRVLSVLRALGYVEGWELTTKGTTLTRIYGEGDLLVGEALESGLLDDLRPSEVVALLSAVIYEGRERIPLSGEMPTAETKERYERLQRLWRKVRRTEDEHQVQLCRELEAGFATADPPLGRGRRPLDDILAETEMAPGDFIRNCKQLVDLLRQIEDVATPETAAQVRAGRAGRSCGASSPTPASSYDAARGIPAMTSPFGTIAVIVDPRAGIAGPGAGRSSARSTSAGSNIARSSRTGRTRPRSRRAALDEGFRFLVAMGNDATVQDVVNGMFREGHPIREEPVLGVIGAGSGCDLVRSFGVPGDTESAAAHLAGENTYGLDLMKITSTDLGGGAPAHATDTTSRRWGWAPSRSRARPRLRPGSADRGASTASGAAT